MKRVSVFGTLDFRVREELGTYVPDIQRNVIANVENDGGFLVFSENYLITEICDMVTGPDFRKCYSEGEIEVVDEAVAACQKSVVQVTQLQLERVLKGVDDLAGFLNVLGHSCLTTPKVGFSDRTTDSSIIRLENGADVEALRSRTFSEASIRNWIDMIVSAKDRPRG